MYYSNGNPLLHLLVCLLFVTLSHSTTTFTTTISNNTNSCDIKSLPDPLTLRSDQLTVLISGFSPSRIPLLSSLALSYSSHPSVSSVLILWFNSSTPSSTLSPLLSLSTSISVHFHSSSSLTDRFLPRPEILTRYVIICDDDIELSPRSLSFSFRISTSPPYENSLVGFFARSHHFDLSTKSWIYTIHPDRYSIILTKFMILKTEYLYRFSCWEGLAEARAVVERERNCEDILMNFVVAMDSGQGPVLVEAKGLRDWGDPRNQNASGSSSGTSEAEGALSKRGDHRKKRGECIREFHRLLGEMPLRYSYGKVAEGVGEQGLCRKGGKLVYCDREE